MPPRAVVARETELDRLRGFLVSAGAAVARPAWRAGDRQDAAVADRRRGSEARGQLVLVHRAVEAEAALAFTGIGDVVGPVLAEVGDELPEPRRRALRVALLLEDPGEEPPQPQAIGLALLDVLTVLCAERDVVVAIDDLQWLDSSSAARAAARAAPPRRRTPEGARHGPRCARRAGGLRARGAVRRGPRPGDLPARVDLRALHRLLSDRLGVDLTAAAARARARFLARNPLFALELGREMAQSGGLHVPASLREALDARLERCRPARRRYCSPRPRKPGRRSKPWRRNRGTGGVGARRGRRCRGARRRGVRFTHPLLASRCYERASPWTRRAMHGALAAAAENAEQRARHLALASRGRTRPSPCSSTRPCAARRRVARPLPRRSSRSWPSR